MHVMAVAMRPQLIPALAAVPDVRLCVLGDPSYTPPYADVESITGVVPFTTRGKFDMTATRCIRESIARHRPDIIHAFYGRALANVLAATAWKRGGPKIVSFRGITARVARLDPSNWISYLHPRVAAHACESNAVRESMIQSGIPPVKCFTTYNCVRLDAHHRPGREALASFGVPDGAFVVGTVATMRRVKGIDLLLRAAIECRELDGAWFVLIGHVKDPRVAALAAHPRIRDRVHLPGHRPDAVALISGADVFVLPSRAEALSIALMEAMSQRVCPVVSDAGGMKELVRDEIDGLVVPRGDVSAISGALCRLRDDRDLLNRCAESAEQRVRAFASPDMMARRTAELYAKLVAA